MRQPIAAISFLFAVVVPAQAAPLVFGETLPTNISNCVAANTCTVGSLVYATPIGSSMMTAYSLTDFSSGSAENKTLVHYALDTTSSRITQALDNGMPLPPVTTPITGGIWLELNNQYDLAAALHPMSMFLDQVSSYNPYVWNVPMTNGELKLTMASSGLLAGSGVAASECCSPGSTSGTLLAIDPNQGPVGPFLCVADGCSASVTLNLLNLGYLATGQTATLVFNSTDPRAVLYSTFTNDPWSGGSVRETFAVRPVPVPAALWLLLSGMVSLAGLAGRRVGRRH